MQSWDEQTCHDPTEVTKVQPYSQSGLQLSIFKLFHVHAYKKTLLDQSVAAIGRVMYRISLW